MHAHLRKIAINQFNAVTILKIGMKFVSLHRRILLNYAICYRNRLAVKRIQSRCSLG